jgi:hypothetical protein
MIYSAPDANGQDFMESLFRFLKMDYPKFFEMDPLSRLGVLAAEILLKAKYLEKKYAAEDIGIVLCNANSSLDTDIRYSKTIEIIPSPALFVYTLPNIVIGEICIRNKIKGENAFFVFPRFDATFIEQYVNGLVNNNILQVCLCGWVDWLEPEYKAALFLVEKEKGKSSLELNEENLKKIYL